MKVAESWSISHVQVLIIYAIILVLMPLLNILFCKMFIQAIPPDGTGPGIHWLTRVQPSTALLQDAAHIRWINLVALSYSDQHSCLAIMYPLNIMID